MNSSNCLTSSSVDTSVLRYWNVIVGCGSSSTIFQIRFTVFCLNDFQNLKVIYPLPTSNLYLIENIKTEKVQEARKFEYFKRRATNFTECVDTATFFS